MVEKLILSPWQGMFWMEYDFATTIGKLNIRLGRSIFSTEDGMNAQAGKPGSKGRHHG